MTQSKVPEKENSSHKPAIGLELWPTLQQMEREGKSLQEVADWLLTEHQIQVSVPTCSRALARIRAAAPIAPSPAPVLDPATDEDVLRSYRARFHKHATCDTISVHAQIAAARLVLAILTEQRERRVPAPQPVQPAPEPVTQPDPAAPALTPEEEADWVRRYSGSN